MGVRRLALAFVLPASLSAGTAGACVRHATDQHFGPPPTAAERLAEAKRLSALKVRVGMREARLGLANGVDPSRELAELLVPNVRPVMIESSSCGDVSEVDHAGGLDSWVIDWLSGTDYGGRGGEFSRIIREFEGSPLGEAGNGEVRDRSRPAFAEGWRRRSFATLSPFWRRGARVRRVLRG